MAHRRPSGDGLVRKRKDGRWEGRIMVGRDQEGKPIYRSVVDKSQKEMLERLHGLIEAYREVSPFCSSAPRSRPRTPSARKRAASASST